MKKLLPTLILLICGCNRIYTIQYTPSIKPSEWCQQQPCIQISNFVLSQPTSSILVFILALLTLFSGCHYLISNQNQYSRKWWGYTLLLSGFGAVLAGISYQLFGYELKCSGKEYCNWTNWFEIYYNFSTVASAATLLIAIAYSCLSHRWIKLVKIIALIKVLIYFILCFIGAILPNKFLVSYEFLVIFAVPTYVVLFIINGYQYVISRKSIYKYYLILWLFLFIILGIYFTYLSFGLTELLWEKNIWFSANDILHVLMIFWILYIQLFLNKFIVDR